MRKKIFLKIWTSGDMNILVNKINQWVERVNTHIANYKLIKDKIHHSWMFEIMFYEG